MSTTGLMVANSVSHKMNLIVADLFVRYYMNHVHTKV